MIQYFRWTQNLNMCYVAHIQREVYMKYIRILLFTLFLCPIALHAASNEFVVAAQLLSAAKNADFQQVQALVNSGADINFVDSTGLSIVCTALMNNDIRAAQILQMYGADASQCDRQIKQYNSRTKPKINSGGLFGGLSTAQGMALAAAGAAVVIGGLYWLTDVFDPDNGNSSSSGNNGNRPNNNPDDPTNGSDNAKVAFGIPYSPAYLNSDGKITTSDSTYQTNLTGWNPSAGGVREWDFNYFRPEKQPTDNYLLGGITVPLQNYLLIMHGYSAFANEYMGQFIFRDNSRTPVVVSNAAGGGQPVRVGVVTDNGVSSTGSLMRGDGISYADAAGAQVNTYKVDKFFNYNDPKNGVLGAEKEEFDFSNSGTAINPFATENQNAVAKIIAGWEKYERALGDLYGFVPNGQLAIYRTGGGNEWKNIENPTGGGLLGKVIKAETGSTIKNQIEIGDEISISFSLNGTDVKHNYKIENVAAVKKPLITVNGTTYQVDKSVVMRGVCNPIGEDTCENVSDIAIYMGTDKFYYINYSGGDRPDAVYVVDDNNIYSQKIYDANIDVKTFEVLQKIPKNNVDVLVNTTLNPQSRDAGYLTIYDFPALLSYHSDKDKVSTFMDQINAYYDRDSIDETSQGAYANKLFNGYSNSMPMLVMSAGEFAFGSGTGKSLSVLDATFENYAPVLYNPNLNHTFMTVVAVQHVEGTTDADAIEEYGNGSDSKYGHLYLSFWENASNNTTYSSRKCGVAGTGTTGIDPWCFAAAGPTAEMATASAAGAVATIKGAFDYMSTSQIFSLLALTADGAYLGTKDNGESYNSKTLTEYLKSKFSLPPEYYENNLTPEKYLDAFKDVYGYGLINLERATTPGKSIYYYDGQTNKIISASGNAYWRNAQNTTVRSSIAFNPRTTTISAPFFDILTSVDGNLSLPRVWKNEFSLGTTGRRGLYMGDVLGDLHISDNMPIQTQIGDITLAMSTSHREYTDNFGGLDNFQLGFSSKNWDLTAGYQHYFTDNTSRFDGAANPILSLASNAVTSGAQYHSGNWTFGLRAFSGTITDEGLLETDPTISAQYKQARLGLMHGAQSGFGYKNDKFGFDLSFGSAMETETFLGAQTNGLLDLGAGHTMYVDNTLRYAPTKDISFGLHSTFARTTSDATGEFILGMSNVYSDAYAFTTNVGNFSFSLSQPLAITRGVLRYSHADYDIITDENGHYNLNIINTGAMGVDLRPAVRELRINASYKHKFGEFTDGAFGFIYRVNPNNTDAYGNESILMMKMHHRIGI
ncbi:MAG: ankyrin repeat domain-containing protein [Alphaproteobacteria bacterium]|nr:ankyrin repeat domain-containing protein [Alphaproteobacteria bacterium]